MAEIQLVDLDNVEIVTAIERAFQIKIAHAEAAGCATVGDVFAVLMDKLPLVERGSLPCPSASAFWRLRAALAAQCPGRQIAPATPLADLMPRSRQAAWWTRLARSTGLDMPNAKPPSLTRLLLWLRLALAIVTLATQLCFGMGAWSIAVAAAVFLLSRGFPAGRQAEAVGMCNGATVGDLAKIVASLNIHTLTQTNGAMRVSEAWSALEGVLRNFTGYSGPIDKRTRFKCV